MPAVDSHVDTVKTVLDLLIAGFNPANISVPVTPAFSTGVFNRERSNSHQVTVGAPDEVVQGAPNSGYSGIRSDGSGGSQTIIGTIQVSHWSHRDMSDITGFNPKQIVFDLALETRRIMFAAGASPGGGLHTIAPGGYSRITDISASPVAYQGIIVVTYSYDIYPS